MQAYKIEKDKEGEELVTLNKYLSRTDRHDA